MPAKKKDSCRSAATGAGTGSEHSNSGTRTAKSMVTCSVCVKNIVDWKDDVLFCEGLCE